MIIECSNCGKKFKIQEDRLPKGKIIAFPCKNCGDKFRLDLRNGQILNEKPNESEPSHTDSAPNPQPENETDDKDLKDKILNVSDSKNPYKI
jgi:predicted  nucleic acid-binding Zn-ribbon protein